MDALLFGFLLCLVSQAWAMPVASKRNAAISLADTALYQMNRLAQSALDLTLYGLDNRSLTYDRGSCTLEKLRVRRDWRALSHRERRSYIDSILCLQRLPPQTPSAVAAGAKTRYDDFLATHINQTWQIHRTVSVAYQNDIRNELLRLINFRARFWRGIGISSTHSKRLFVMNVATAVTCRKSSAFLFIYSDLWISFNT